MACYAEQQNLNVKVKVDVAGNLTLPNAFRALENPQFRLLFFGNIFSFLGMQMQVIARGYLAYDLTGRNSALGGVMLAFGLPQLVLSLWGGVVADRLPKRHVLMVAQLVVAANSACAQRPLLSGNGLCRSYPRRTKLSHAPSSWVCPMLMNTSVPSAQVTMSPRRSYSASSASSIGGGRNSRARAMATRRLAGGRTLATVSRTPSAGRCSRPGLRGCSSPPPAAA